MAKHRVSETDQGIAGDLSDLRRNMNPLIKWFMWLVTKPKEIRPGLLTSIDAAYTIGEIEAMLPETRLQGWTVRGNIMGLVVVGRKPPSQQDTIAFPT